MTRVYLANEPLTRNDCHVGIQKLFGAINRRREGEKTRTWRWARDFPGGFEIHLRDKSRRIPARSAVYFHEPRACAHLSNVTKESTWRYKEVLHREHPVDARARSPSSCCPPFEKISRVFVRQEVDARWGSHAVKIDSREIEQFNVRITNLLAQKKYLKILILEACAYTYVCE